MRLDAIELAMRNTDAEERKLRALSSKLQHDGEDFPLHDVREIVRISEAFARRAHSMPVGVRIEVSYRNIFANAASPEAPDQVVYNLLLSERCEPGPRSSVAIGDHLEYLSNKALGVNRTTTIRRRMGGEIMPTLRSVDEFYLLYEAWHRFQRDEEDEEAWKYGVPFAGIQVEAEASERIQQYSWVLEPGTAATIS